MSGRVCDKLHIQNNDVHHHFHLNLLPRCKFLTANITPHQCTMNQPIPNTRKIHMKISYTMEACLDVVGAQDEFTM